MERNEREGLRLSDARISQGGGVILDKWKAVSSTYFEIQLSLAE